MLITLLASALLTLSLASCGGEGHKLRVYGFQAGKADAFLITTDTSAVLIDCGLRGFGKEIVGYLEDNGIESLDYLIITHFDKDHVGGAAKVINSVPVKNVLQSNYPKDSDEYKNYVKALENAGIEAVTVREAVEFTLDGVSFSIDPPKNTYLKDESNNSSLIVTIENASDRLIFMGDAETERIEEFLKTEPKACDFMKVAHHGKAESALEALLDAVGPQYSLITSDEDDLESNKTVEKLENSGAEVFYTRKGPVIIESFGNGISVRYE